MKTKRSPILGTDHGTNLGTNLTTTRRVVLVIAGVVAMIGMSATDAVHAQPASTRVPGLRQPVELARDSAGIVHIRAANEHDLFFAQGYSAARDRLFQLELWRRQATGTMAEALGPRWVSRDRASRLLKYRGDMKAELAHYHPRGAAIIGAFVDGVNAYVAETERDSTLLPPDLVWLGVKPGKWTPEVVVSRHNALASNAREELPNAEAVRMLGENAVRRRKRFEPASARLAIDSAVARLLDAAGNDRVLAAYDDFKNAPAFRLNELAEAVRKPAAAVPPAGTPAARVDSLAPFESATAAPGPRWESNNWVVAGSRTVSGKPIISNDPHRTIATPSLRYLVHLTAPGWDVIGGGEPAIPGVSIGHNGAGAWGLTIFGIDAEDLYVYDTGTRDARAYRYRGAAERMREVVDTIRVRGAAAVAVRLRFTRHGPVLYEDTLRHVAVALRAAWIETGGAPYLASLRIDQATTWPQFREALRYAHMPALNWIWGDTTGAIGWQSAGIAPIRRNWDGLVPVPGDGRFEWSGFLPIPDLPHVAMPKSGAYGTANAYNVPAGYAHMNAVARTWAEPFRLNRLTEVLDTLSHATVETMAKLQHDETSLAARALVPLLRNIELTSANSRAARDTLLAWNGVLSAGSVGAAIYAAFERRVLTHLASLVVPLAARDVIRTVPLSRAIEWITRPDSMLGENPAMARDFVLFRSLNEATGDVSRRFGGAAGEGIGAWRYGDAKFHHARIAHPFDRLLTDSLAATVSPGPLPRGGYANTLNATGNTDNQTAGASMRVVMDLANWDSAIATNTPGQSGDPRSRHYMDLFPLWAAGKYVPLPYSRAAVNARTESVDIITP